MMNTDIAIVGGGAAGLAAAVTLLRNNKNLKVTVIDAGERLGKKLAATGNGQGNVTNSGMSVTHYHGSAASLASQICCQDYKSALKLFHCLFEEDEEGRVYPSGRQASALSDSLVYELKRAGAMLLNSVKVIDIEKGFILTLSDGQKITAKFVVIACGGKAQKQFKTDGSGYILAQKFGHTLTRLYPSLVQLKTETTHIKTLKGIRVYCKVNAFVNDEKIAESRGDVIFTDYGLSGNAIFKISPYVADKQNITIGIEFLPDISSADIEADIKNKISAGYPVSELLGGTLHNQLGRAIIKRSGSDVKSIVATVKNFELPVVGTLGFDYAQVTRGGIDAKDIGGDLQSKLCRNLYFAGEVLDIDGDCGGYNLHWAFSSGIAVANEIIKRYV